MFIDLSDNCPGGKIFGIIIRYQKVHNMEGYFPTVHVVDFVSGVNFQIFKKELLTLYQSERAKSLDKEDRAIIWLTLRNMRES